MEEKIENPREFYKNNGYYIFRKLIPTALIDELLTRYQSRILPAKQHFFRQSTNQWEKSTISEHGYVQESFLNVHDFQKFPEFSFATREIFCSAPVRAALSKLTEATAHSVIQTMLFDQNTATPPHQDYFYLDSVPNGHLLAGWFAMENITEAAGRFFVLPKSHFIDFELTQSEKSSSAYYVKKVEKYYAEHPEEVVVPALEKGDVLFWNSKLIHGSLPTKDPKFSRKSLTAHYLPSPCQLGNITGQLVHVDFADHAGMPYRLNERQYSTISVAKYQMKNFLDRNPYLRRLLDKIKSESRSTQ